MPDGYLAQPDGMNSGGTHSSRTRRDWKRSGVVSQRRSGAGVKPFKDLGSPLRSMAWAAVLVFEPPRASLAPEMDDHEARDVARGKT